MCSETIRFHDVHQIELDLEYNTFIQFFNAKNLPLFTYSSLSNFETNCIFFLGDFKEINPWPVNLDFKA